MIAWVMVFIIMRGVAFGLKLEFGSGRAAFGAPRRQSFRRRFISSIENPITSSVNDFFMGKPETPNQRRQREQEAYERNQAANDYYRYNYNAKKYAGTQDGYKYQNMANDARNRM